jgi:hypothetical protein
MTRLLADLDSAIGLSQGLARAMDGVAASAEGIRGRLFPSAAARAANDEAGATARLAELQAEIARLEAGGPVAARRGTIGRGAAEAAAQQTGSDQRIAELRQQVAEQVRVVEEAQLRRLAIENEGDLRAFEEQRTAQERRVAAARTSAEQGLATLRGELDRRIRIREEAAEREVRVQAAIDAGVLTAEQAAVERRAIARRRDEELAAVDRGGRGGRGGTGRDASVTATLQDLREQQREGEQLATALRTPLETLNDALARYQVLLAAGAIDQETFNRAVTRAGEAYRRALPMDDVAKKNAQTLEEAGRIGERAFDRVGQSITQALAQGQLDFKSLGNVGLAIASELTQAFLRLAIINPIKNAAFGGNATTFGDLIGFGVSSYRSSTGPFYGSGPATVDASGGGFLFHTGGIVGVDAAPWRRAAPSLFNTAPRLHGGGMIGPSETPAILQRGEGVFTEAQMARLGPAGGSFTFAPTVNFKGDAGSPADRATLLEGMRAMVRSELLSAVPGIIDAAKGSLRTDVHRMGKDRALGSRA